MIEIVCSKCRKSDKVLSYYHNGEGWLCLRCNLFLVVNEKDSK